MAYQNQPYAGTQQANSFAPQLPPMNTYPPCPRGYYSQSQTSAYEPSTFQNGHHVPETQQRNLYQPPHYPLDPPRPSRQFPSSSSHRSNPPSAHQSQTASSTAQSSDVSSEGPRATSRKFKGFIYSLEVVQQPDRARMCGFGDKDRRPISPPPCVRLVVIDESTGKEVDYEKVEDLSRFILIVDLADVQSLQESNLVLSASSTSQAIGSTYPGAFPHTQIVPPPGPAPTDYDMGRHPGYERPYQANGFSAPQNGYSSQPIASYPLQQAAGGGSRNLIGSLSATAFKLQDCDGKVGLWFIFQDLSIRTEGFFRLKFTFFDLMCQRSPLAPPSGGELVDFSPLLASAFSDPFQVWSAKKFPGVRQTTVLSQCFADQGIKIPVRKQDAKGENGKRERSDDEEEENSAAT